MASADAPSGYSHRFVDNVREYECAFCLQVARDPVQISTCGHSFCQECWKDWATRRPGNALICPVDKKRVKRNQVFDDRKQDRLIRGLKVYCVNQESGCEVTPELRDFESHLTKCRYEGVECPLGCGKSVLVRSVDEHRQQHCPKRLLICQACREHVAACAFQAHSETCPMKVVVCDLCQLGGVLNKDLVAHKDKDCPSFPTHCSFAMLGCTEKIVRSALPTHHQVHALQHLTLVTSAVCGIHEDAMPGVAHGRVPGYELPAPLWGRVGQVDTLPTPRKFTDLKDTNDALTYEIEQLKETNTELRNEIVNNVQKTQECDMKMQDQDQKILALEVANQRVMKLCEDMGKKFEKLEKGMKGEKSGSELRGGDSGEVQVGAYGGGPGIAQAGGVGSVGGGSVSGGGGVEQSMEIKAGMRVTCPCYWQWQCKVTGSMEVFSPPFYTQDGYKMCLRVLCGGSVLYDGSWLHVYCHLMAGERDRELRWPWAGAERMRVREVGSGRQLVGRECGVKGVGDRGRDRPQWERNGLYLFYNCNIPNPGDGVMIQITVK